MKRLILAGLLFNTAGCSSQFGIQCDRALSVTVHGQTRDPGSIDKVTYFVDSKKNTIARVVDGKVGDEAAALISSDRISSSASVGDSGSRVTHQIDLSTGNGLEELSGPFGDVDSKLANCKKVSAPSGLTTGT